MPLSYNDVRKLILQTLEERPEGTKVQVPNQQNYELALLDYVQQLQTTMATSIVGIADEDTEPIEPPTARISYLSQVGVNSTMKFNNFVDAQLNPISVTTDESHVAFVTLFWNTNYWQYQAVMIPVIGGSGGTTDYNSLENIPTINGVEVKGDLTGENLKLVDKSVYDAFVKKTEEHFKLIDTVLFDKIVLEVSVNPNSITAGQSTEVVITWDVKFDGESVTPDAITISRDDGTIVSTDVELKTVEDTINKATQYTISVTALNSQKEEVVEVTSASKMYIGASALAELNESDVLDLTSKDVVDGSAAGDIDINFEEVAYLWICVPQPITIKGVTSSGFAVPMKPAQIVEITGVGNYNCYRSVNQFAEGQFLGTII